MHVPNPYTNPTEITLPQGLVVNTYDKLGKKVKNKATLKKLLTDLAMVEISSDKDGLLSYKGKTMDGLKFEETVVDLCNNHFHHCYEAFYRLLKECNIIF